jgi:hypothetical protein
LNDDLRFAIRAQGDSAGQCAAFDYARGEGVQKCRAKERKFMLEWASIIEAAAPLGIKAVERFFEPRKKQDTDLVSIGLAVGYYYNFLEPVSSAMNCAELELFSEVKGNAPQQFKSEGKFKLDDVRVQIIVPSQLTVTAFQRCQDEFNSMCKGFLFLPQNKRYYGINYSMNKLDSRTELQFVDLARPIMAVKRYYEDIVRLDTGDEMNLAWLKIQATEIKAFKESVCRLQKRGYGALVNKLDFRDRC